MAFIRIACMGLPNGIHRLIGEKRCCQILIEREKQLLMNSLADGRVVDDQQVKPSA